jgi:hypothetical protein
MAGEKLPAKIVPYSKPFMQIYSESNYYFILLWAKKGKRTV